jgi:carboxyl-terminal processing protease
MFRMRKLRFAAFIAVVFLVGGVCGAIVFGVFNGNAVIPGMPSAGRVSGAADGATPLSDASIVRVKDLARYLEDNYYAPITAGAMETGLLRGLFSSPGDPYTIYYTEQEFKLAMERTHGELSGVGLTLSPNEDGLIEVVSVVDGSPAHKAGILKGDLLISVDGEKYAGDRLTEAVEAAQGEAGTKVEIGISRDGEEKSYTIERSVFVAPTVSSEFIEDGEGKSAGYIRVTSFNDNTSVEFESALKEMGGGNVKGFVIDMRGNAGGLVDKAVEMDDMLLDESVICYAEDRAGKRVEYSTKDGRVTDLPYVVLIDGSSVSAAEIFALGIKAGGGGKLVGQTTYGKGLIQKLDKFEGGDGARITIMQYVTPDGDPVNGVGISPDITVEQPEGAKRGSEGDVQLEKALSLL